MKSLYCKVCSVVRRDNSIMLYLDRPLGYTITPMSLYELYFDEHKTVAPIANGNTVRALKFLIPKNRDNYWVTKLTERDIVKVNSTPVTSFTQFAPTSCDVFYSVNQGVANFISYFTEPEYVVPNKFIMEVQSLNDCYELPLFINVMQQNFIIYIHGKVNATQREIIKSDEKLKHLIKFGSGAKEISKDQRVFVSTNYKSVLEELSRKTNNYTNIPISL
jgi:hypothetical protein